jgi:alpha-amylase/alpha-mannosidase (GH57 family)
MMIKTVISACLTFLLIFVITFYESNRVNTTFTNFEKVLLVLYDKVEFGNATIEDGEAVESFWESQKNTLHIWLPHSAIQEVDYQLYEAVGYVYVRDFKSALPKIEVLLGMCENIPQSYRFSFENIL